MALLDTERYKQLTPGPWTYDKRPRVGASEGCEIRTVEAVQHTAVFAGPLFVGTVNNEANARLIAAAPDLLQACRDTLTYWESTGFAVCEKDCDCIVDQMRAAILKAEGAGAGRA